MGNKNPHDKLDRKLREANAPRIVCHVCEQWNLTLYKVGKAKYACGVHKVAQ